MDVSLESLVLDDAVRARAEYDTDTIDDYASAIDRQEVLPPLVAVEVGQRLLLADGWHRYYAMKRRGIESATVNVTKGTLGDAIALAASANVAHGRRRTNADKRRCVQILVESEAHGGKPDIAIARLANVDPHTVKAVRLAIRNGATEQEITAEPEIESEATTKPAHNATPTKSVEKDAAPGKSQAKATRSEAEPHKIGLVALIGLLDRCLRQIDDLAEATGDTATCERLAECVIGAREESQRWLQAAQT